MPKPLPPAVLWAPSPGHFPLGHRPILTHKV